MGARHFTDLDAWQLASDLKRSTYALVRRTEAARDFAFRDQLFSAAASACANISEGSGRYHRAEFARFLRIAVGSLEEVENHLIDGVDRGYFSAADIAPLVALKRRAAGASTQLVRYLKSAPPRP